MEEKETQNRYESFFFSFLQVSWLICRLITVAYIAFVSIHLPCDGKCPVLTTKACYITNYSYPDVTVAAVVAAAVAALLLLLIF